MTKHRVDLGGAVVANSSGRPGDEESVRGLPPQPDEIQADPGGRGLGLSAGRPENSLGRRSGRQEPGGFGRHGRSSGPADAAVGDPTPQGSTLNRPDAAKTRGTSGHE